MPNSLKILQWNCQSIRGKRAEFEKRSREFDIILISESWLHRNDKFLLKDFDTIKKGRTIRRGGGVAIFVSNNIKYSLVNNLYSANDKLELCAISIEFQHRSLLIVSLYKAPNAALSREEWNRFFEQFDGEFLMGGDFNSHNPI